MGYLHYGCAKYALSYGGYALSTNIKVLEVVNGVRCVLWVLGVMLCMRFCSLFCLLLCVMLCIREAVEGELRLREVLQ